MNFVCPTANQQNSSKFKQLSANKALMLQAQSMHRDRLPWKVTTHRMKAEVSSSTQFASICAAGRTVAFFDLDHTLLDCDSGSAWLKLEFLSGQISLANTVWAVFVIIRYRLGFVLDRETMQGILGAAGEGYFGRDAEELAQKTGRWFSEEMGQRIRPGALKAIEWHRAQGDVCIIATATSQFIAHEAVKTFGFDGLIASELEVKDGILTGKFTTIAYGDYKCDSVRKWAKGNNIDLTKCTFYTDSMSDSSLMELVGCPIAVNPDRKLMEYAKEKEWDIVDWGFSEMKKQNLS